MANNTDIAEEQQGGGKKKLIIIILVALVLLLGAGAAAFFLLGGDQGSTDGSAQQEDEVEKGDPVYHKFEPAFVVHLTPGGSVKMLQIAIEVMTRTPTVIETLKRNDPMIRHHMLNLLEQQQAADLMTIEGREALQQSVHDMLGEKLKTFKEPGQIEGVFFTQFVMQ